MFKLVLFLPFDITLVWRERFESEEAARKVADTLPQGFTVKPDEEVTPGEIHEVPRLRRTYVTKNRPNHRKNEPRQSQE